MPLDKTKVSDTAAITPDKAIALFDSLAPAEASQMIGKWRGAGIATGHKMDGMLESSYWYGKEFRGPEDVFSAHSRNAHLGKSGCKSCLASDQPDGQSALSGQYPSYLIPCDAALCAHVKTSGPSQDC